MDKEELVRRLEVLANKSKKDPSDPEWDHEAADQLLLDFIDDHEVDAAFQRIYKWYA